MLFILGQASAVKAFPALAWWLITGLGGIVAVLLAYIWKSRSDEVKSIRKGLDDHVRKEEEIHWPRVEKALARLTALEGNVPDAGKLHSLIALFEEFQATLRSVAESLSEHERESEGWKQRIVAMEVEVRTMRERLEVIEMTIKLLTGPENRR
jgi:hypothetical protein